MLSIAPFFGSFISTLIVSGYLIVAVNLKISEIGALLQMMPIIFFGYSIFSFIMFKIIKKIFRKEKYTYFKEMWIIFLVTLVSILIGSIIGGINYYYEEDLLKSLMIVTSIASCIIFSYTFDVSLKKIEKNQQIK